MGVSQKLHSQCRATLLKCSEFDDPTSLRTIFVINGLSPFRDRLPEATDKSDRVDKYLEFLLDNQASDGQPLLSLFLDALRGKYREGDALRDELERLILELDARFGIHPYDKTESTFVDERTECQSGDVLVEEPFVSGEFEGLSIPNWVKQIPEPFIRELEEKLRMNEVFWQKSSFQLPAWNSSFAAVYFSQQASRLLELRDFTDELHASLQSTNLGSIQFHEHAHTVLDQVLDQAAQITQLVAAVPQHPLGITTEKAVSRVTEEAQSAKRTLRRVAFETVGGPSVHPQLRSELTMLIGTLAISLDELQKYLQEIGHEAQTVFLSLN